MRGIRDLVPSGHHDLLERPLTAALTTIDARGRPQTTAVWYLLDEDGELKCSTTTDRQKYANLTANPTCGLFVIDPVQPFRTLEVRADAELVADPGDEATGRFVRHYGASLEQIYHGGDRFLIVLRPWRVVVNPPPAS